jgi:hypothetical protein
MTGLILNLADIGLEFKEEKETPFFKKLRQRYAPFASSRTKMIHAVFQTRTRSLYHRVPSNVRFLRDRTAVTASRSDFEFRYEPETRKGVLEVAENPYSFDSCLRVLMSWLLPRHEGLMIHSASLIREKAGYIFPAVSGGGKSTLTRMAGDAEALTDELSLVRWQEGGYRIYGSPFWGELAAHGRPVKAVLEGIYFLKKGPAAETRSLSRSEAVRGLLETVMSFDRDPSGIDQVMGRIDHLTCSVNARQLTFSKSAPFWHVIASEPVEVL